MSSKLETLFLFQVLFLFIDIDFINNRIERSLGMDLNGDGYIGGQGKYREKE